MFLIVFMVATSAHSADVVNQSQTENVLGRAMGATTTSSAPEGLQRLKSSTALVVLGKIIPALQAIGGVPSLPNEPGTLEYYSFGKRIFAESSYSKGNGFLQAEVGLAPVEVRVPIIKYPIGPLVLGIDGGVRFQAQVRGQIQPTIWTNPVSNSIINMKISGNAAGQAFLEGSAQLVVLRGGLGGDVELIDGKIDLDSSFYFNGTSPQAQLSTLVQMMYGGFYAFADVFNVFGWKWKRFWKADLFTWKGKCFSSGKLSCTN
ncbi:MAG: hypothetical protein KA715_09170 [Xanthomonadaceae bacterium]|nr:hypothetical protein [Xanthomonadaceae bacterium]